MGHTRRAVLANPGGDRHLACLFGGVPIYMVNTRSAKAGGGILPMALHAVTIWQVDPKGQWISTFGVTDIAVQRTGRSSRFVWSEGPP